MASTIELLHLLAEATSGIAQYTCGVFNLFQVSWLFHYENDAKRLALSLLHYISRTELITNDLEVTELT